MRSIFEVLAMAAVRRICDHTSLSANDAQIEAALAKANERRARLNVGKSGRGKGLSPAVLDRLHQLAAHYPDVDFSEIGLSPAQPGVARIKQRA